MFYLLALLLGVVAGLRSMVAAAAISWAAAWGWIDLSHTIFWFMGAPVTPWIFTVLALAELIGDQWPTAPSRTVPTQFAARIVSAALCGAVIGAAAHGQAMGIIAGLIMGVVGAIAGTLGGTQARARLVAATGGRDFPIALLEDAIAIGAALWIVSLI